MSTRSLDPLSICRGLPSEDRSDDLTWVVVQEEMLGLVVDYSANFRALLVADCKMDEFCREKLNTMSSALSPFIVIYGHHNNILRSAAQLICAGRREHT